MNKKIIGFNEILTKRMVFIESCGGENFYAIQSKIEMHDNVFLELDCDFVICVGSIQEIKGNKTRKIDIINKIIGEFQQRINNNRIIDGAIREYLFQTGRISPEENQKAIDQNLTLINLDEQRRIEEKQARINDENKKAEEKAIKLLEIEALFKNNQMIPSQYYLDLCEKYGIVLPIRIIGWINSKCSMIGINAYQSSSKSTKINCYTNQLRAKINQSF